MYSTYGGCYDIAKRNITIQNLPTFVLTTLNKGVQIECISKPLSFDPHGPLPKNYKQNYGIRICGYHEPTGKPIFYGFDLFYQVTGGGLDLENFLNFCFKNGYHIDWYNFYRTSQERENWSLKTLTKKISYFIIEVYGKEYWSDLKFRIYKYEWSSLEDGNEVKELYRPLFSIK